MGRIAILFIVLNVIGVTCIKAQTAHHTKNKVQSDSLTKTTILVLGTIHLDHIKNKFSPDMIDSLISVLQRYHPSIICIEALSGPEIAEMEKRGGIYNSVAEYFAGTQLKYGHKIQSDLNLSWQESNLAADSLLEKTQQSPPATAGARLNLINYLLASYRLYTAALQWSYLTEKQRSAQSAIPENIAMGLTKILHHADERASISLRLAHKLKRQRVYPIDDFIARNLFNKILKPVKKALKDKRNDIINADYFKRSKRLQKQGIKNHNLLPLYEFLNSPAYFKQDKKIQWRRTFFQSGANKYLRKRLALWQVRNLHIAAHIRKASAHCIGCRVLVTIGASHKVFLDTYLGQLMGVKLLNLGDIN